MTRLKQHLITATEILGALLLLPVLAAFGLVALGLGFVLSLLAAGSLWAAMRQTGDKSATPAQSAL